jgi:flagellar assembly factor FliW
LPGFEAHRRFVLLELDDLAPLKVLHAVNGAEPCFLVVDPTHVLPNYRCQINGSDRRRLAASDDRPLVWLAMVMAHDEGQLAVNLRAPIVINPSSMLGRQVMPNACVYPLKYVIEPSS